MTVVGETKGAVLPLVLGIVLAVTLMLTTLLHLPGGVRRTVIRLERKQQAVYDAESAILANLYGLPESQVLRQMRGPWMDVSAEAVEILEDGRRGASYGRVHALAGVQVKNMESVTLEQWRVVTEGFRSQLLGAIMQRTDLQEKSGNRRLLGKAENISLKVTEGDLLLDLEGTASCGNFYASGSLTLKGSASYDTLRLYAAGPLRVTGDVRIHHLEAFSGDNADISQRVTFAGIVAAQYGVSMQPSAARLFKGCGSSWSQTSDNPRLQSTSSLSQTSSSKILLSPCLIPPFIEGSLTPFEWFLQ